MPSISHFWCSQRSSATFSLWRINCRSRGSASPSRTSRRGFAIWISSIRSPGASRPEECFFRGKIPADVVFDMVYNPLETLLARRATEQGCEVIRGIQMFLEQAAHQFEIWTGETAPRPVMEKAAMEALASQAGHA